MHSTAANERESRPEIPVASVGVDPEQQKGGRRDLGQVPAERPQEAEVPGEDEPPDRKAARAPRQEAPSEAERGQADHVRDHEGGGHTRSLSPAQHPCERGVADAAQPRDAVEPDAEGAAREVERVEGDPVVELPVVPAPTADGHARGHLSGGRVEATRNHERPDVAAGRHHEPTDCEHRRRQAGDHRRQDRGVLDPSDARVATPPGHRDDALCLRRDRAGVGGHLARATC